MSRKLPALPGASLLLRTLAARPIDPYALVPADAVLVLGHPRPCHLGGRSG